MSVQITPAEVWNAPFVEGVPVKLPSGKIAKLRPVSLETILALGRVPNMLKSLVEEGLKGESTALPSPSTPEELAEAVESMDVICLHAFVTPKLVDVPIDQPELLKPGEVNVHFLEYGDKGYVMRFLNAPAQILESFRYEPNGDVEPVPDGEGHESAAVATDEVEGMDTEGLSGA